MKVALNLTAALFVLGTLVFAALAQEKVEADKLPQKVKDSLNTRFPGHKVTQATKEMENGQVIYDVEMTVGSKKTEMDCKEDGTVIDIQIEVDAKELPAAGLSAIKAKYPGIVAGN